MILSRAELAACFEGTPLDGLPVRAANGGVLVIDLPEPEGWFACWQAARDKLEVTGRWPVAYTI